MTELTREQLTELRREITIIADAYWRRKLEPLLNAAESRLDMLDALSADRAEELAVIMLVLCVESLPSARKNPDAEICPDCDGHRKALRAYASAVRGEKGAGE